MGYSPASCFDGVEALDAGPGSVFDAKPLEMLRVKSLAAEPIAFVTLLTAL
ncbi:MAG: hypothetical protein WAM92_02945 [Mycobacterium sp.]